MCGGFASELTHKTLTREPKPCTAEFQANISTPSMINHIYLLDCSSNAQQDRNLFYVKATLGYLHFFVNTGINT